jgi:hypothetical protein
MLLCETHNLLLFPTLRQYRAEQCGALWRIATPCVNFLSKPPLTKPEGHVPLASWFKCRSPLQDGKCVLGGG